MALNRRLLITDKWMTQHRPVAVGAQVCGVVAWVPKVVDNGWNPLNPDGDTAFDESSSNVDIRYIGTARVQPNKDWRARYIESPAQIPVQHAWRIQLDYDGNRSDPLQPNAVSPIYHELRDTPVGTMIRLISLGEGETVLRASMLSKFTFFVRNISESSNSWVRTLMCDVDVSDISANELGRYGA